MSPSPTGTPKRVSQATMSACLSSWEPPSLEVSITPDDRQWARELVTANSFLREDQRSKDWVGKPVGTHFGLDQENKGDGFGIKKFNKRFLDEGALKEIERIDGEGHGRKYMTAGTTRS